MILAIFGIGPYLSVFHTHILFFILATYPLDLTKTRLQIQGEKSGDGAIMARRGMVGTAAGIGN